MKVIELPMAEPLPEGCECHWAYNAAKRVKYIKNYHANCKVTDHVTAYKESYSERHSTVDIPVEKKGRGRPRNNAGQWHKKRSA